MFGESHYCPCLANDSFELPTLLRRANCLAAAAEPLVTQRLSSPCPPPSQEEEEEESVTHLLPSWCCPAVPCRATSQPPVPQHGFIFPLQTPAPCFLEGKKFLPEAQKTFYCHVNVMNCWNRAMETSSKWKIKLCFFSKLGKTKYVLCCSSVYGAKCDPQ